MRKTIRILTSILAACFLLTACAETKSSDKFISQNEIFTYKKLDPEKTQLVIARTGNIPVEGLCDEFEKQNSDIQVIYVDITGGNDFVKPVRDWLENGYLPDVLVFAAEFLSDEEVAKYFENLSACPAIDRYSAEALTRVDINDNIYCLPGPSNIRAITYNKTLFDKYGWELPKTFDDFIELCLRIREDTGGEVEPWNPNAKYAGELQAAMEAFTYEELFGGVSNRTWYNGFLEGKESFAGHMEPYFEALQRLIDNGLLREEHFSYSATARGKEFYAGKIAMISGNITGDENSDYKFGYIPFPTTKGELGYICDSFSCFVGVPKKARDEKLQDAVDRFIEFFSSPEGQRAYMGDALQTSNVLEVPLNGSDSMPGLREAINSGHTFEKLEFMNDAANWNQTLYEGALNMTLGVETAAQCVAAVDAVPRTQNGASADTADPLASAPKDMTILETSFYIADAYRSAAGADIGLIPNNEVFRGNVMRIFAGDITSQFISVLKPRSFANGSSLVKASMTGRQLLDALNAPSDDEGNKLDCVYAYSGLKCTVAPWNEPGQRYVSVALADGSAIEPDKLYSVAFWEGTVNEAFLTGSTDSFEQTWEELMTAKVKADGSVVPADDGRIKLVWK